MGSNRSWRRILSPADQAGKKQRRQVLPQQESLPNIVAVVEHHNLPMPALTGKLESVRGERVNERIVGYYRTSARLLRFLDDDNIPTPSGRALVRLNRDRQIQRIAYAFEASAVGEEWLRFEGCSRLEDLNPGSAGPFVLHYQETVGRSRKENETTKRRVRTLRNWLGKFKTARQQLPIPGVERRPVLSPPVGPTSVFDTKTSGEVIERIAQGSRLVQIATAYFSLDGYVRVAERLDEADLYLLIGSDERSGDDVKFLLRQFAASLRQRYDDGGVDLPFRRKIIRELHDQLVHGRVRVRRFDPRERSGLHAKVYLFDRERGYVTSANLTRRGLHGNVECGRVIRDQDEIGYLAARFSSYFEAARPFTEPVLVEIERSWALWEPQDPELVLLKILDAIFGRLEPVDSRRYQLANYQQAIVATLLRRFESQDRVLLLAPTGSGKTVMGAYVAAALKARGAIDRVIVVCKNRSMREAWKEALGSFRIYNDVVRTYDLERAAEGVANEPRIAKIFADVGPDDLLIVDECHHYRRDRARRQSSLVELLDGPRGTGAPAPAKALLMTATPISTGIEDVQSLLKLVAPNDPPIAEIADVARHRGAVNISLGQVLRDFGVRDGVFVGLNVHEDRFFFPRLQLQTVGYPSDMDRVYEALATMDFTVEGQRGASPDAQEDADDDEEGHIEGRHGFIRALIARRAESSLPALTLTLDRLEGGVAAGRIRAAQPSRFLDQIARLRELAQAVGAQPDRKLKALLRILRRALGTKVVIFTEYVATADYLHDRIEETLACARVGRITGDMKADDRRAVLVAFAPIAQRAARLPRQGYDLLVATDAISEGENLQDANLVVNYDLSWTPLRLIQRVGRINRFTKEKRKIGVRNFFPGTQSYEQIVSLRERLEARGQQVRELSDVDYLGDGVQTPAWLARRKVDAVVDLHQGGTRTVTWADLLAKLGEAPTSRIMDHLWGAPATARSRSRGLPDGVQACACGRNSGLYVLLDIGGSPVALFRDLHGVVRSAPQQVSHERLLAAVLDIEPSAAADNTPPNILDEAVGKLVEGWMREAHCDPDEVAVVAAIHIVSAA